MPRVALLDDYQNVAMDYADWSRLPGDFQVQAFSDHLTDEDALVERLAPFEIIQAMRERTPFPASLLERLPNLKYLITTGARNASIDMAACTRLGIVCSGTGYKERATSELTWGLIHCLTRDLLGETQAVRDGAWQINVGLDLDGATLGLLGLGRIGGQMAAVANAFGMNVLAWSQNLTEERARECSVRKVGKEELLEQADIVSVHVVLSDRTRGLLGKAELARMKPTAFLVNTSRGPIVDEQALAEALNSGRIAGAGVDVFEEEPMAPDHPFRSTRNLIITPHIGYVTAGTYRIFYGETVDNILGWLEGKPPRVINKDVLGKERKP